MSQGEQIHPMAIVEPGAQIGQGVTVEAYAVVKSGVILGDGVTVKSYAYIDGNTSIGEQSVIWPAAVIGTKAQDLKFSGEKTYVYIGKRCQIREFATINSSCYEGSQVVIGDDCLIMACCHVAHNCRLGNRVIMSNNAILAGHVEVEDWVTIGGMTPVHQFVRIGRHAMVGGMSRVTQDVPPFTIGAGTNPFKMGGINRVGLKRRGFSLDLRKSLARCYRWVYRSGLRLPEALARIETEEAPWPEVRHFVEFCRSSKRGLIALQGVGKINPSASVHEEDDAIRGQPILNL